MNTGRLIKKKLYGDQRKRTLAAAPSLRNIAARGMVSALRACPENMEAEEAVWYYDKKRTKLAELDPFSLPRNSGSEFQDGELVLDIIHICSCYLTAKESFPAVEQLNEI